jgi:hypothetical protein
MYRWAWVFLILGVSVQAEDTAIPDPDWRVARAQFATAISDREPVDDVVLLTSPASHVYFFTDLRHLQERTVTHLWKFGGRVVSIVPFEVGGPRWRVNSRVEIEPDQLGEWSVTVVDESGWPLYTELFHYVVGDPVVPVQSSSPAEDSGVRKVTPDVQDILDDSAVASPQGVGGVTATPEKDSSTVSE